MDEPVKRKAVVNGAIQYTSVSQIQKFDEASGGCQRQWFFKYVLGLPDKPPSKGQKRGTEGHGRIQKYLTTGLDVLDPLERLGLPFMPGPDTSLMVEHPLDGLTAKDIPIVGYIDLAEPGKVTDWKFKKSIELYGSKNEDLGNPEHPDGIQMIAYGVWLGMKFPTASIRLRHVTFQTEGRRDVKETFFDGTLDGLKNSWEKISERVAEPLKRAAKASSFHEVKPNEKACFKYGGCPYAATCLDPMARISHGLKRATKKKENPMGMLSTMFGNGAQPAAVAAQVAPAPAAAPKPVVVPAGNPVTAAKPLIQDAAPTVQIPASGCVQKQQYRVNGVDCTFLCLTTFGTDQYASFAPLAGGSPVLVSTNTLVGAFTAPSAPAPAVVTAPAPVAAAPVAEAPKRGRGRPPKAATVPSAAPAAEAPTEDIASGVYLYINCAPIGVQTQGLGEYVEGLQAALYDAVKKGDPTFVAPEDLRLAEGNAIGFGKWKAYLAGAAAESLPAPGHYIATQGDDREATVVAALLKVLEPGHVVIG